MIVVLTKEAERSRVEILHILHGAQDSDTIRTSR